MKIGSNILQCSDSGQCDCKPGVTGEKCDRCDANYWNFNSFGCETCGCYPEGSFENIAACDATDGNCYCKQNVEGKQERVKSRFNK